MERLITAKELKSYVPYCRAHIARLEAAGQFPKRVRLGTGRVAWRASDIEEWQQSKFSTDANPGS